MKRGDRQVFIYNDDVEGIEKDISEEDYSDFVEDYDEDDDDSALNIGDHDI